MPVVTALLVLTLFVPGQPPQIKSQSMSLAECLELAEAWLNQPSDAPALRHGAKLSAACQIEIKPSIEH